MKLLSIILFCSIGVMDAAETDVRVVRRTNYIAGPSYPVSTNEFRPYFVLTGTNSHVKERGCFRVTTREEWTDLWLRHTGQTAEGKYFDGKYNYWNNPGGVPEIDFTRCIVLALLQGPGVNSAGFDVAAVVNDGEATVLRVAEKWYQTIGKGHKVVAFGFFVFPRSDRALIVEENDQHLTNGPLIWKERARFARLPTNKG